MIVKSSYDFFSSIMSVAAGLCVDQVMSYSQIFSSMLPLFLDMIFSGCLKCLP